MNKNFKIYYTFFFVVGFMFASLSVQAQVTMYINGDNNAATQELYINGDNGIEALLYINGHIVNNRGNVSNYGSLELSGNFTNHTDSVGNSFYQSQGKEIFSGNSTSMVSGNFVGFGNSNDQFFDLKINKQNANNYVSLNNNAHINRMGSLTFLNNGILSTGGNLHTNNADEYPYYIYLQNAATSSLQGHTVANGANTKYIEGKFKRNLDQRGKYYFPVGVSPLFLLQGMESFELDVKTTAISEVDVLAYLKNYNTNQLNTEYIVYTDVASSYNGNGVNFSVNTNNCNQLDNVLDRLAVKQAFTYSWVMETENKNLNNFNYNIEFFPSLGLENTANFYTCGINKFQFLLKANAVNGDNVMQGNALPTFSETGFLTNTLSNYVLGNQNSIEEYRVIGSVLPDEFVNQEFEFEVNLFPNPVSNSGNIDLEIISEENTDAFISLYDIIGSLIFKNKVKLNKGSNTFEYDAALLASGKYIFRITTTNKHKSIKNLLIINK